MFRNLAIATSLIIAPWAIAGSPGSGGEGISFDHFNDAFANPGQINGQFITGGQLSRDQVNLFHSFSHFNVKGGESVAFLHGEPRIENIIARVTGGERSKIAGDIDAFIGSDGLGRANLFLLNPRGIIFNGSTSSNLSALVASTAHAVEFDVGKVMRMDSTAEDLIDVTGHPSSFHIRNIDVMSDGVGTVGFDRATVDLSESGGDLVIVASDVELNGSRIRTEGAQIALIGAGTENVVTLDVNDRGSLPAFETPATGRVLLTGAANVQTDNLSGGRILIRGGEIVIENSNPALFVRGLTKATQDPGIGIDVEATQNLTLSNSQISAKATGEGVAGSDIRISSPRTQILWDGKFVQTAIQNEIEGQGRGGNIDIDGGDLIVRGGQISAGVSGGGVGGAITITSDSLTLADRSLISAAVSLPETGNAGDISIRVEGGNASISNGSIVRIQANDPSAITSEGYRGALMLDVRNEGDLRIEGDSSIQSIASGSSDGADVSVKVGGDLVLDGNGVVARDGGPETAGIVANSIGRGRGGGISLSVGGATTIRNGGVIDSTTFDLADAGPIRLTSRDLMIDGENHPFPTGITGFTANQVDSQAGRGGDIEVNVSGDIEIYRGGQIDTSSFGSGDAGSVFINQAIRHPSGSLLIDKGTATRFTGIGSEASGSGNAGEVRIRTGSLLIYDGGLISTGVFFRPMLNEDGITVPIAAGSGAGGDVTVFAESVRIRGASRGDLGTSIVPNSAIYAGTQAGTTGHSGRVFVESGGSIEITEHGLIGVESLGSGDGGALSIRVGQDLSLDRASITARASIDGGNIDLSAIGRISLFNGSEILAEAGNDGGNVTIRDTEITVLDASRISANAVRGTGGNIVVGSDFLLANSNSSITASSQFGTDGMIQIDALSDLSGWAPRLDEKLLDDEDEKKGLDPSKLPDDHSSFVESGRGGIPVDPTGYLPSARLWELPGDGND